MEISKFAAQKKLATLWFVSAGLLAILFVVFTAVGRFDTQTSKGWEWYSQNVVPTLGLMLSTFFINYNTQEANKVVDIFFFKLSYGISLFYLLLLYLTVLLAPLAFSVAGMSIIELFEKSKIYFIIVQGILTYSLGLFFTKEATKSEK